MTRYRSLFVDGFKATFRWPTIVGAALIGIAATVLDLSDGALLLALLLWIVIAWFTFDQPSRQERRDRLAATKRRTAEINARTDRINALRADLHAGRDIGEVLAEFIILEAEREAEG